MSLSANMSWRAAVGCVLVTAVAFLAIFGAYYFMTKGDDEIDDNQFLTERDFEAARSTNFESGGFVAAEYNNGLFEGDIALEKGTPADVQSEGISWDRLWPRAVVPYEIERSSLSSYQRSMIANAFEEIAQRTCVQFLPRSAQDTTYYIRITTGENSNEGCWTYPGRIKGGLQNGQPVMLGSGCWNPGTVRHELMHVLGFYHEQSRTDRDRYVKIVTENILPEDIPQFRKSNDWEVTKLGTAYDFGSVMHYDAYAFAIDRNQPTIVKVDGSRFKTQRDGFSETDVYEINKLYNCSIVRGRSTTSTSTSAPTWIPRRSTPKYLPGKATTFLGSEYIYVQLLKTWAAAEQECVGWGGHLASIHSFTEKSAIKSLSENDRVWIGYKYFDGSRRLWSDGSSNDYMQDEGAAAASRVRSSDFSCATQHGSRQITLNVYCKERHNFVCKR